MAVGPTRKIESLRSIRVGSTQAPKIKAVSDAFSAYVSEPVVQGVAVPSGVPEQPVGFAEIVRGARNRAEAARTSGACDLGAGIEDGLIVLPELAGSIVNVGCAWLTDGERESFGLSSGFGYPPLCDEKALTQGEPIGDLFDTLWRERVDAGADRASGPGEGNIGRLSGGVLTRAEYGRHAVLCALVRFVNPDLYPENPRGPLDEDWISR
ncbi:MAG: inosine/xanthosine triphosphatase [Myxococcota bacterium]|nr:inosine/xanthosine triphosphatase [Myxococcota bacterium]